jgi:hypothetical protein
VIHGISLPVTASHTVAVLCLDLGRRLTQPFGALANVYDPVAQLPFCRLVLQRIVLWSCDRAHLRAGCGAMLTLCDARKRISGHIERVAMSTIIITDGCSSTRLNCA